VQTAGTSIKVFVNDMTTPLIDVRDGSYASGSSGVRVFNAAAAFDDVAVSNG
jgi:hypothetical protein